MRAIGFRYAANGEIGISDCLELFQTMVCHDIVELSEVLVELVNDARWLHCFDEAGEVAEIDKDHGRRVEETRLNALSCFKLVCDGWWQDIQEQSVRYSFLCDRTVPRVLQFKQHLVALKQLPAQFEVNHCLP